MQFKKTFSFLLSSILFLTIDVSAAPQKEGLLLIVSDSVMGGWSEIFQQLPISGRTPLYGYDKIERLRGELVTLPGRLEQAATRLAQSVDVVDVVVFSHGGAGSFSFRATKDEGGNKFYSAAEFAGILKNPLNGRFRMFYAAACGLDSAVRQIVDVGGARVAIGHKGLHTTPLTFPLKFLKYFKTRGMTAEAAASRAWAYVSHNPNPAMRLIQPLISRGWTAEALAGSQPVLAGDPWTATDTLLSEPPSRFATNYVLIK